jgi:predicted DNA-binding antitoxin AbrB/MazE fold protein
MTLTIEAVYENGVLKPAQPLPFKEHEQVRITIAGSSTDRPVNLTRLMAHAGAVDLGRPTGAENALVDADLAREYGSSHEDGR